jgi:hypothetical protein
MYLSLLLAGTVLIVLTLNYKKMDFKEKILSGILLVIVFSCAINNYRNEQLQEAFKNMSSSEEEIKSADFEDLDKEDLEDLRQEIEELENVESDSKEKFTEPTVSGPSTTTAITSPPLSSVRNNRTDHIELIQAESNNQTLLDNLDSQVKNFTNRVNKFKDVKGEGTEEYTDVEEVQPNGSGMTLAENARVIQQKDGSGVNSIFSPQIIINDNDGTGSDIYMRSGPNQPRIPLRRRQNVRRNDWMIPERDLWNDDENIFYGADARRQACNTPDNKPDIENRGNNSSGGTSTRNCHGYDTGRKKPNMNYQMSPKTFYPGYAYQPPSNWDVPQKRAPVCINKDPDTTKLPIGIADHGTPINALEVDPIGRILTTEEKVQYTNVGSILPKFRYSEEA